MNSSSNEGNPNQAYYDQASQQLGRQQQQQESSSAWMQGLSGSYREMDDEMTSHGHVQSVRNSNGNVTGNGDTGMIGRDSNGNATQTSRQKQDSNLSSFFPPPSPSGLHFTLSNSGAYANPHPLAHRSTDQDQHSGVPGGNGGGGNSNFDIETSSAMSRSLSHGFRSSNRNEGAVGIGARGTGMGGTHMAPSASGPGSFGNGNHQSYQNQDQKGSNYQSFGVNSSGGRIMGSNSNPQIQAGREPNHPRRSLASNPQYPRSQKRVSAAYGPSAESSADSFDFQPQPANRRHNSLNQAAAVTPPRRSKLTRASRPSFDELNSTIGTEMNSYSPEAAVLDRNRRSASGSGIGSGSADAADADASGNATATGTGTNSRSDSLGTVDIEEEMNAVEAADAERTPSDQPFDISGFDVDVPSSMVRAPEPSLSMGRGQHRPDLQEGGPNVFGNDNDGKRRKFKADERKGFNSSSNNEISSSSTNPDHPSFSTQPQSNNQRQFLAPVPASQASYSPNSSAFASASDMPGPSNSVFTSRIGPQVTSSNSFTAHKRQSSGNRGSNRRKPSAGQNGIGASVASDSTGGSHPSDNEMVVPFTSTAAYLGPGASNPTNSNASTSTHNEAALSNPTQPSASHKINATPYQATTSDFTRRKGWSGRVVEEIVDFVHVIDVSDESPGLGEGSDWKERVENGMGLTTARRRERSSSSTNVAIRDGMDEDLRPDGDGKGKGNETESTGTTRHSVDSPLALHFVGPSITGLTGWSPDDLRGKGIWEFIHPDDVQPVIDKFAKVRTSAAEDLTVFYRFRRKPRSRGIEGDSDARSGSAGDTTSGDGDAMFNDFGDERTIFPTPAQNDLTSIAMSMSSKTAEAKAARKASGKAAPRVRNEDDPEKDYVLFEATGHAFFGPLPSAPVSHQSEAANPSKAEFNRRQSSSASGSELPLDSSTALTAASGGDSSTTEKNSVPRARSKTVTAPPAVLALFCSARVYPSETVSMLDSFLELKVENEKLRGLIDKVQNNLTIADEEEKTKAAGQKKASKVASGQGHRKSKAQKTSTSHIADALPVPSNPQSQQPAYGMDMDYSGMNQRDSSRRMTSFQNTPQFQPQNQNFNPPSQSSMQPSQDQLSGGANWFGGDNLASFPALDPNLDQARSRPDQLSGMRSQTYAYQPPSGQSSQNQASQSQQQQQGNFSVAQPPHSPSKHRSHPYSRIGTSASRSMSFGAEINMGIDHSSSIRGIGNQSHPSQQPPSIQSFMPSAQPQVQRDSSSSDSLGQSHSGNPVSHYATVNQNGNRRSLDQQQQQQAMIDQARRISAGATGGTRNIFNPSSPAKQDGTSESQTGNTSSGNTLANSDDRKKKPRKAKVEADYVCTDCGRVDSPEWRKGPQGPKTLCNACGLRYAKSMKKDSRDDDGAAAKEKKKKAKEARKGLKEARLRDGGKEGKKSKGSAAGKANQLSGDGGSRPQLSQVDPSQNQVSNNSASIPQLPFAQLADSQQQLQQQQNQLSFQGGNGNGFHNLSMGVFDEMGMGLGLPGNMNNMNMMDMDLQMPALPSHMNLEDYQQQFQYQPQMQQQGRGEEDEPQRPIWN